VAAIVQWDHGSWPAGLPKKDRANALSGAGSVDTATTRLSKTSRTKTLRIELKHSIATHLLDAGADLAFVKDWLGHANIQSTTIYARLTTATLDSTARKVFASHRVV